MKRLALLPLGLALGLGLHVAPAQAQLRNFCSWRVVLQNIMLDERSINDARRPWLYSGVLTNTTSAPLAVTVTYTGPSGTMSQATGRNITLPPGQGYTLPLVQYPKSMTQPQLGSIASGLQVQCP